MYRQFLLYLQFILVSQVFVVSARAQLCTGSLGDPVVNITFGNGTDNTGFTAPGYTYTVNSCPNDGFYTIVSSSSGCFGGSWHAVTGDHTGGGAFMLVNASNNPGDFFVNTVTGLCPNTTYEFSAWIMNVLNRAGGGIKPNITFKIETVSGLVLGTYNSGDIPETPAPVWNQYGFFFTTSPGTTDVVIRLTNNAPGGIGNDLALDDITFRPCGPSLTAQLTGFNTNQLDICINEQQPYDFTATLSPGFSSPVFRWQLSTDQGITWADITGETTLQYHRIPTLAGNYWYRITAAEAGNAGIPQCRIASMVFKINVHPKPIVNAGADRVVVAGGKTQLSGSASGENITFGWTPPDYLSNAGIETPVVTPLSDMRYKLSAVSRWGCYNEDFVNVQVVAGIFVPNAFSPNNDGKNDTWRIPYLDPFTGAEVNVYNRYGQLVYHVTGAEVNWDGKLNGQQQPAGTYVYYIRFKDKAPLMKGTVTLIR